MAKESTIQHYTSSITGNTPSAVDLASGELAINIADEKVFLKNLLGNVVSLSQSKDLSGAFASKATVVTSFNGATGAVTGATLGANTFTALNTFSAGISASSGVTFSKDITVNSMTVGLGGASDTDSVAFGKNALVANTDGSQNLAIGSNALASNTDGEENVAIGRGTLQNTSSASYNVAIGSLALGGGYSVGFYNIAIGRSALGAAGNTGSFNTGIGFQSLQANTTGINNVGIGYQSLYLDTTGLDNTGIGTNTLKALTTGSYNTGVGSSALRSLTTASQMTALGYGAGRYRGTGTDTNTTGTGGIYIGYQARGSTHAQTNEIVIGVDALGLGSNTAVIGATTQSAATIYGVLNLPSGLSASGATFSGPIISTGYQISSGAINAQTASYSLVAGDNGKIVTMNVASANNLTVPASLAVGFNCTVIQLGAGQTTILASGTTLNSYQSYLKISGQHGSASIVGYTSNVYNVAGNLSA